MRATTASVIALIEPVTAAVVAVLLLDERLTVTAVAGSVVLLGAVVALTLGEWRASAAQQSARIASARRPTVARTG